MIDENDILLWLDNFDFLTYKKKEKILELVESPTDFINFGVFNSLKDQLLKIIEESEFNILVDSLNEKEISKIKQNLNQYNINFITVFSPNYPETLKNIDTPPFVLYYKGDISLIAKQIFAVVGTRHITNYGKLVTENLVKGLVLAGFTIASGLAIGVDTVSHSTTLDNEGKTIGVLAGGLDSIYPAINTNLAKRIIENGGLLLSETRPNKQAETYMFPIRNRIIAGLSRGVLITEAGNKSGAMHTKNYALDYGKDVFCVPGNITSIYSEGTNRTIVNGHAKAVVDIADILVEYGIDLNSQIDIVKNVTMEESIVVNLLKEGEKSYQELLIKSKLSAKTLNSLLTTLSIHGIIKKLAGNIYYLKN